MEGADWFGAGAPHAKQGLLGALLLESGALDQPTLDRALAVQGESAARLGEILIRNGSVSRDAVAAAAARQRGVRRADLRAEPLDPTLLDEADLPLCLAHGMAPWRRIADRTVFVATDYETALQGLAGLGAKVGPVEIALTSAADFAEAVGAAHGPALARRAAARPPETLSARRLGRPRAAIAALAVAAGVALAAAGSAAVWATAFLTLAAINMMNAAVRITAVWRAVRPRADAAPAAAGAIPLAPRMAPPRVTLLIPLLDEPETLPMLIEALGRLDWPRELLDVKLILEAHDARTRAALEECPPPPFCQVLTVPPGGPRTKPRALNFALDFAEGEIVGVYDAEDRPEPDQIRRAVAILRAAPPEVACVQCRLSYYNPRDTWLTRCFTIEYAMWFDVLLAGFRDLRMPIPLGGTSLFFRRSALERIGAWDAHNVTEDADLGMRLARAGYRTEVCASTTYEEASSRPGQWLRQRSRWLKGYMATWLVHMRDPARLWRDLGPVGFFGFQTVFLGAAVAYLGLPVFWLVWSATLLGHGPAWLGDIPDAVFWALVVGQVAGWGAMLTAAVLATARRGQRWLWPWIPTLMLYWPIGAAAAYMAVAELLVAPALWRKTPHGLAREATAERAEAVTRLTGPSRAPRAARGR
jgi:cellulose synthase/poly-beta-1,6-N-acetylglucosamine synthase-like glycosyltransferase